MTKNIGWVSGVAATDTDIAREKKRKKSLRKNCPSDKVSLRSIEEVETKSSYKKRGKEREDKFCSGHPATNRQ